VQNRDETQDMTKLPSAVKRLIACGAFCLALAAAPAQAAGDRHAGYYYPADKVTKETYVARSRQLGGVNRVRRLAFVSGITNKLWSGSYPPPYMMFAKGATGEKLIIVGMGDYFRTLFQARALLASLSAQVRTTKAFREFNIEGRLTFFDLAYMMGFEQVTISDGKSFTHQVTLERDNSR